MRFSSSSKSSSLSEPSSSLVLCCCVAGKFCFFRNILAGPGEQQINGKPSAGRISRTTASKDLKLRGTNPDTTLHAPKLKCDRKKKGCVHSTRSRRIIGEDLKTPTFKHKIRNTIVVPDQGDNW